jgi:hypothetical protein
MIGHGMVKVEQIGDLKQRRRIADGCGWNFEGDRDIRIETCHLNGTNTAQVQTLLAKRNLH